MSVEKQIRQMEEDLFNYSNQFVRKTYIAKMIGSGEQIGDVNSFLHEVDTRKSRDKGIEEFSFNKALTVLSTWSSSLKSLIVSDTALAPRNKNIIPKTSPFLKYPLIILVYPS